MKIYLHQTHHNIADFDSIFEYLQNYFAENKKPGLHIFPELYLCGYPLKDLCLHSSFISSYLKFLNKVNEWSTKEFSKNYKHDEICILLGGLAYSFGETENELNHEIIDQLRNVIYQLNPGHTLKEIYVKRLLPNYDIFDEKKYFTAGSENCVWEWLGQKFGLQICEDMWASSIHRIDPCQDLYNYIIDEQIQLDGIINLSGSPYYLNKRNLRIDRATELSQMFQAPFIYVNRVGGEDEILFDGSSIIIDNDKIIEMGNFFDAQVIEYDLPDKTATPPAIKEKIHKPLVNTWEGLFQTQLTHDKQLPTLKVWNEDQAMEMIRAMIFGVQEYAKKTGFKKFLVALSGGMDSALVLTLLRLGLKEGQHLEAVYMPGMFSASLSFDLSARLCHNLEVPLHSFPIKFLHSTCRNQFAQNLNTPLEGLPDENIQSRLRGMLIYGRSNQTGAMVINTSNKSELAVGYSTQYGDSVGAISMMGDIYKTEVYRLSEIINAKYNGLIPSGIIDRAPSAELRPDQEDSHSLPPYERLDAILECILSCRYSREEILNLGFDVKEVDKVYDLYSKSEYKRWQFCPIIKVKAKSFGFGYRVPLAKSINFYKNG